MREAGTAKLAGSNLQDPLVNRALSKQPHSFARPAGTFGPAGGIEWEELPSLAGTLGKRFGNSVWDPTMPAPLDALAPSAPLRETLSGLATREVLEPDVFEHFFGSKAA
jgi:hypothetical protein